MFGETFNLRIFRIIATTASQRNISISNVLTIAVINHTQSV